MTGQKFGIIQFFFFFFLTRLYLFDQKYSKNCNILKYYYNLNELFSSLYI